MSTTTGVEELGLPHAEALATMLRHDEVLRRDLGVASVKAADGTGFLRSVNEWCRTRRATTYAIVAEGRAIGTISISHVSEDGKSARIGYWIGSAFRGRGHASRAFCSILEKATAFGITKVSATVATANIASRRIWEKHRAERTVHSQCDVEYTIRLPVAGPERAPQG